MRGISAALTLALAFAATDAHADVSEGAARALLQTWLTAQNDGDFRAYQATYAQKFYGVKRSGPRTTTFDRSGWLKDRERMFRKKMAVSADDVAVRTSADAAVVTFTQTWESGIYKDVGPKQLVMVMEGPTPPQAALAPRLVIAREELLASDLVGGPGQGVRPSSQNHSFVFAAGGSQWVVISQGGASLKGKGPLSLIADDPAFVVQEAESAAFSDWKGRAVKLYDAEGKACDAKVESLHLGVRFYAHFGMLGTWRGTGDSEAEGPMAPDKVAADAWDMLTGDERMLVGRLSAGCGPALWARDAAAPAPAVAGVIAAGKALHQKALTEFRGLAGWARLQKAYQAEAQGTKTPEWTSYEGAKPGVRTFQMPDGRQFISVWAAAGSGCGDFGGELWAAWEVKDQGKTLMLLTDEQDPGHDFVPDAVFDLDGDGRVEIMGSEQLMTPAGATLRPAVNVRPPSFDCGC